MRLAQRLGAETVTLPGQDVADTIAEYARANNFTHIIIVQPPRSRWRELFYGSLAQAADPQGGGASVHVLGRSGEAPEQQANARCASAASTQGLSRQPRLRRGVAWRRARCCTRCWASPAWR